MPDVVSHTANATDEDKIEVVKEKKMRRTNSEYQKKDGDQLSISKHLDQERNLAMTLVFISILFITCQSFKIIPDLFEFICKKIQGQPICVSLTIDYFTR